ncbi:relaxase domain-containing protein [Streptomyces sp. TRM72054]|uniref:relaxase domain-containing protein n=1 Tax=Streptomyces sp. TRM72054 TaxID=2870562 RepID=UPI0027DEE978|nr:relaxase domain-containing protein [Streptomyces sp. TRM72054]
MCEELGLATVPREVTPGLRPVVEIAGVDQELIDWSSTRRQRVEDVLEGITDQYVKDHGRLPGERARHGSASAWSADSSSAARRPVPRSAPGWARSWTRNRSGIGGGSMR